MFERRDNKFTPGRWVAGLVLGIVLLWVYYPVLTFDYLYHDDWVHFNARESTCRASPMYGWSWITGRLFGQYVLCGLFGLFNTIAAAWLARLVILGGIAAFAFLQSIYFQALGISWIAAVSLALGTSVLPGMLVFGYWITAGSLVFSLLASVVAALLTHAAVSPGKSRARRSTLIAGACALQTAALLIYQTEAMYFWALAAVMLATLVPRGLRGALRPLAAYALVGAVPMIGYFIWFRYLSGLAPLLLATDPVRGPMFSDVAASAKWFFSTVLPDASLLWFFDLPRGFGLAVLVVYASSLILLSARRWLTTWRKGDRMESLLYAAYPLVIMALAIGAFFPMLVTDYRLEVFRSLVPLSALIFLTGAIHLGAAVRTESWPPVIKTCVAGGFLLGLCVVAAGSLLSRMILPAAAKYSFVRNSMREAAQRGRMPARVHVVVPRRALFRTDDRTDEIDNLTVQDVAPMLRAIAREMGLGLAPVSLSLLGEPVDREGALVVDFGELSKSGLWRSVVWEEAIAGSAPLASKRIAEPLTLWAYDAAGVKLPQVIPGAIVIGVPGLLPTEAASDSQPRLLRSHQGYNLVAYRGRIYGVPQALGPVNNWEGGMVGRLPGVVTGATVSDVISHLAPDATMNPQPTLLRSHQGYSLVAYRGRIYGVPHTLGRLGGADWESGRIAKLAGVIIGSTVEEVLAHLPK